MQKAQAALERMNDGMAILLADDAAREAFNIANRAIHLSINGEIRTGISDGVNSTRLRFGLG